MAYFVLRHCTYFGIFIGLFFAGVKIYLPVVVVFAVAHSWKASLYLRNPPATPTAAHNEGHILTS